MEIRIENLSKAFNGNKVLENINLHFNRSGIYCIMGPSGRGKTTLLRIMMGLEPIDQGNVFVDNVPLKYQKRMRAYGLGQCRLNDGTPLDVGAVFQEDRLCDWLDAVYNVAVVPMAKGGADKQSALREASKHLRQLLPEESIHKPVSSLSGGMRRRVAIARAMASQSELLLMDEPFSGLDELTKENVIQYILQERGERLLIVVSHQKKDADLLGAQIISI
ncbi:MAG: ABC transporter ATP-binding protein [Clostridiales bacterium]|nr:ABC transporter ATP-binding protein [Clostridiales bacterium]